MSQDINPFSFMDYQVVDLLGTIRKSIVYKDMNCRSFKGCTGPFKDYWNKKKDYEDTNMDYQISSHNGSICYILSSILIF